MAIKSVKKQGERSGIKDGKLTHTVTFLVVTTDPADGTLAALTADDGTNKVPAYGSRLSPNNPLSIVVTSKDAEPLQDSLFHFTVTVEYAAVDPVKMPGDPLNRPPEISYSPTEGTETYFTDRSPQKRPVVNSAGDPFESFHERECGELTLQITINEPTHNAATADAFSHTTNAAPVTIDGTTYATGTLKLSPIGATKQTETVESDGVAMTFKFYRRTYTLKARREGWKDRPLDVGTNELVPDADATKPPRLRPIVDAINAPVKKPWPLNGSGRKKPSMADKPAELEFLPYAEADWSSLAFTWAETWA
jgi:hypothetical protein